MQDVRSQKTINKNKRETKVGEDKKKTEKEEDTDKVEVKGIFKLTFEVEEAKFQVQHVRP